MIDKESAKKMKFKSKKPVEVRGEGPGRKYPRVNLPAQLADLVGRLFDVERSGDVIKLTPHEPKKQDK